MTCSPGISPNGSPLQKSPLPDSSTPQPALGFLTISLHHRSSASRGDHFRPQRVQKIEGLRLRFFLSHGVHLQFGWTPILRLQPAISEVQKIERLQRYGSQNLSQGTEATASFPF